MSNNNISMVEARLPPGFRFHPKDDELVCDYLMKKVARSDSLLMIEVDLNKCEPWDIPETACVGGREWYFYSQRDRKYATGLRTNRATASGYWKATGKDRPIVRKGTPVGMRKTLVFYQGRAPKGRKTEWVMHEFRIEGPFGPPKISSSLKEDWVLCRVFYKNREIPCKVSNSHDNRGGGGTTSSSSLPPLTDSYIAFNYSQTQTQTTTIDNINNNEYEQVPCFSIFPQNQVLNHPILPHLNPPIDQPNLPLPPTKGRATCAPPASYSYGDGVMPELGYSGLDPYASCDKKVLKAVLNQLTKMDTNIIIPAVKESPSLGEGCSSDSYLSEAGMLSMWNNQY